MAKSPFSTVNTGKLRRAVEWSRKQLSPYRKHRVDMLRQYVGKHYAEGGSRDRVPLNIMEMATNIFTQHLVPRRPNTLVLTSQPELKPIASTLSLAVNHTMDEIQFGDSLQDVVRDSLYGLGIIKVGLERSADIEIRGVHHDVGQPFADTIDLDDWVMDMTARKYEDIQFAGHRYRLPLEIVQADERLDKDLRQRLRATTKSDRNEDSDDKAASIGVQTGEDTNEYRDHIELWDIWLPMESRILTFAGSGDQSQTFMGEKPLRIVDWDGPEGGPFHLLSFSKVPGNLMPLAPATLWFDLHTLINPVFNKIARQALRQKNIGTFSGTPPDAQAIKDAGDGDILRLDGQGISEVSLGGIDPQSFAFVMQLKDLFSYMAGNLDALGGLGPQSPTLGQDQLLAAGANKRIEDMQSKVTGFARSIIKDLAWYLWTDPLIDLPLTKRVDAGLEIPVSFNPEQREGDFIDFDVQIEPFSMQDQTPGSRVQTIMNLMQTLVLPALPLMAQQGITVDWEGLLRKIAQYTNMTELEDILTFLAGTPQEATGSGGSHERTQAPATHRINERISRPGGTAQGRQQNMMEAMLASGNNGTGGE